MSKLLEVDVRNFDPAYLLGRLIQLTSFDRPEALRRARLFLRATTSLQCFWSATFGRSAKSSAVARFQLEAQRPTALLAFQRPGACCNDRALTRRLLCTSAVDTDAPRETRLLSGPPFRPSHVRSALPSPPWGSAYTHGDPIDLGQPPSTLGCGSGTPRRWMYRDEGCDIAARSPPPHEGTTGVCAADNERYAAGASREEVKAGRGGSTNATGIGARHGRAVWRGRQGDSCHGTDASTPALLSLVFHWSAFLVVAASRSPPPCQHSARASSSLPPPRLDLASPNRVHQKARRSPLALAPPSSTRFNLCRGIRLLWFSSESACRITAWQRAQDDGTVCEPRAGVLVVDAPDGRLVHSRPHPRGALSSWAPTLSNTTQSLVCGPRQGLYRVGPTLPAAVAVEAQAQAYIELSRLSYISHSSLLCTASDSPPVPHTPCSRRSFRRRPPIPRAHGPKS
ncbi:hypothetical protein DFH08DRAFT_892190 [Mycena albidolilacea]|uniref:Uncharacterized protein n=1 Tax=Mycena albidolilacea TaxID=1033008 RepID=A0AAD6ZEC4_9AGAR|nr:hypothetical protein DFH08DRAFT_892190 [Mycena albidolilacea]